MEVQNLSGDCMYSPSLLISALSKLDFGAPGQGAPYFDPRPFTFQNFKDEMTNQYNTAFTPSYKQYINYEISAFTQCVSSSTSGAMSTFTVEGDNGTPFPITNGDTLEFVGQTGLNIGVADPEVRIAMDYTGADSFIMAATNGTSITVDGANDKLVIYDNDAAVVKYINADQLPGGSSYWTADTTALPADYIRVSGNSTNVIVGGSIEVSGVVRTNTISNGNASSSISILPDDSSKKITFGYSNQQGLGTTYGFLHLELATPAATDTMFQLVQGGDLVFKSNASNGHELFRLDQDLNQASAYTVTVANGLGVSGDTEVAGTLSGRTMSGRTLTLKENLGVSGNTIIGDKILLNNSTSADYIDYNGNGFLYKGLGYWNGAFGISGETFLGNVNAGSTEDARILCLDPDYKKVEFQLLSTLTARTSFWTADTTGSDSAYIRTSGNTTSLKVGDNIEMSGTLRTNMISNGSPSSTLGIFPDSSSKSINYGYSTEQGEGTLTNFMQFGFGTPSTYDTKIQTFQSGDLVFKGPAGSAGGEMLRLDPTIGQASAYTVTAENSLAVSGHCFIGGRPTDTAADPKILTIDTEDKVGEQLLSNLNARINFWTADTTGTNSHYIRTSGNTTGVKIGGNLDVSGNTVADGFIIASGTSATPLSAIKLMYEGDKNIAAFLRVGSGGNADKGRMVLYDNAAEVVEITTLDNGPSYINNVGAALAIGSDGSTEGGAGILSASTISGRTLTLKNDLGVTGDTLISGSIGVGTSPSSKLHISTADNVIVKLASTDSIATIELADNSTSNAAAFTRVANNLRICKDGGMVGIPNLPVTRLDVTHGSEVTSLVNNTGGGESVTFGTIHGGGSLTAGKLYFMTSAGAWRETDADVVNTGSNQLLAIAKGTAVSDGMLIRGFFDVHNAFTGTFNEGVPVYVSTTSGYVSVTQPSGSNDFSRVVGYCTNTANVIYFNPDSTFIKIA